MRCQLSLRGIVGTMGGPHKICACGKQLRRCKVCIGGGSYLCSMHGVQKHRCKLCTNEPDAKKKHIGTSLCPCGKVRHQCPTCRSHVEIKKQCKGDKRCMYSAMSHKKVASQKLDDTHCAFPGCDVGRSRYSRDGQHDSAHVGIRTHSRSRSRKLFRKGGLDRQ